MVCLNFILKMEGNYSPGIRKKIKIFLDSFFQALIFIFLLLLFSSRFQRYRLHIAKFFRSLTFTLPMHPIIAL